MDALSNLSLEQIYHNYHRQLLAVAYRITGSQTDAEDMIQELFLKLSQQDLSQIAHLRSYLIRAVTNRSLNLMQSALKKRELYPGPWLPEPQVHTASARSRHGLAYKNVDGVSSAFSLESPSAVVTVANQNSLLPETDQLLLQQEEISYATIVILEQLSPVERAIFVLRESFGFDYREIAGYVHKSETACRKILSRIYTKLEPARVSADIANEQGEQFTAAFLLAARNGDFEPLLELLQEDVRMYTDGGGKVRAAVHPISSRYRVITFLKGIAAKGVLDGEWSIISLNGEMGLQMKREGQTLYILGIKWDQNQSIQHIYMISNPDKLTHCP